jgi:heme O synthase-like polyprenyltransferase
MKTDALALPAARSRAIDFVSLAKPRLNLLVVASALAGYVMAGGEMLDAIRVICTVAGTAPGHRTGSRQHDASNQTAPDA